MLKPLSNLIKFSLLFAVMAGFLFYSGSALSDTLSPDAIAVRVMSNVQHYSPLRWYGKNIKIKGSPQNLLVDGYEAVRDGRTVYVNAANINNKNLYTQIYIISFNQAAEPSTVDIFGQILAHWKFNSNITDDVEKAKIIRDTRRLADLADLNTYLENYKKPPRNDYPRLAAGSYVAGASVSTWPSWQATLAKELGVTLPVDPKNELEPCTTSAGYDEKTCWNQATKSFYFKFSGTDKPIAASPVYWYNNGQFNVNLETSYGEISGVGVNHQNLETSLRFEPALHNINVASDKPFEYQIKVYDPAIANQNAYNLDWRIELGDPTAGYIINKTAISSIAKITGTGRNGAIQVTVKVADNRTGKTIDKNNTFFVNASSACGNGKIDRPGEDCDVMNGTTIGLAGWSCLGGNLSCASCRKICSNGDALYKGKCGNGTKEGPEKCDGAGLNSGTPANAFCNLYCNGWTCDNAKGYHLNTAGDACVLCEVDNAASVKWENNSCKAIACNDGWHQDPTNLNICESDNPQICAIENGTGQITWDGVKWSDNCQLVSCNNSYLPSGNSCVKCDAEDDANAASAKVDANGQCVYTCNDGFHFDPDSTGLIKCVSDIATCDVTNALTKGTSNWVLDTQTNQWGWGVCAGATCDLVSDYPNYVAKYSDTGKPACVNACGFTDNNQEITFRYEPLMSCKSQNDGFVPEIKVSFMDEKNNIFGSLNSVKKCAPDVFTSNPPIYNSIFIDKISNQCKFTYKSDMNDITVRGRVGTLYGQYYSDKIVSIDQCVPIKLSGSSDCLQRLWDKKTYYLQTLSYNNTWQLYDDNAVTNFGAAPR
ncbi:MAG: hypothetical protein Q7R92_00490 [bacterium]|nr:hypothetical protein [bacterium]